MQHEAGPQTLLGRLRGARLWRGPQTGPKSRSVKRGGRSGARRASGEAQSGTASTGRRASHASASAHRGSGRGEGVLHTGTLSNILPSGIRHYRWGGYGRGSSPRARPATAAEPRKTQTDAVVSALRSSPSCDSGNAETDGHLRCGAGQPWRALARAGGPSKRDDTGQARSAVVRERSMGHRRDCRGPLGARGSRPRQAPAERREESMAWHGGRRGHGNVVARGGRRCLCWHPLVRRPESPGCDPRARPALTRRRTRRLAASAPRRAPAAS